MERRAFLKLIALGVVGHELDLDRLLWVPGEKKIFIPNYKGMSITDIVAIEIERIIPHMRALFERDDTFWTNLSAAKISKITEVYVDDALTVDVSNPADIWADEVSLVRLK